MFAKHRNEVRQYIRLTLFIFRYSGLDLMIIMLLLHTRGMSLIVKRKEKRKRKKAIHMEINALTSHFSYMCFYIKKTLDYMYSESEKVDPFRFE